MVFPQNREGIKSRYYLFIISIIISTFSIFLISLELDTVFAVSKKAADGGPLITESTSEFNRDAHKLVSKALDLRKDGKYEEALEYYDKALDEEPNYKLALTGKGSVLSNLGKYDEAIEYYDKALDEEPNYKLALTGKGSLLSELASNLREDGKYEEALEYYDMKLDIDPNDKFALYFKAATYRDMEKYEEALDYFDKALDIDPNFKSAISGKSSMESKLGKSPDYSVTDTMSGQNASQWTTPETIDIDNGMKDYSDDNSYISDNSEISGNQTSVDKGVGCAIGKLFGGTSDFCTSDNPPPVDDSSDTMTNVNDNPPPVDDSNNKDCIDPSDFNSLDFNSPEIMSKYNIKPGHVNFLEPCPTSDSNISDGEVKDVPAPSTSNNEKCLTSYKKLGPGVSIKTYSPAGPDGCPTSDSNIGGSGEGFKTVIDETEPTTTDTNTNEDVSDGTVLPNHPPSASDKKVVTNSDTPIVITLPFSDVDQNDKLISFIVSRPSNGKLGNIDQILDLVTYTPNSGFSGTDTFTFKVNDGQIDSNIATVSVTINPDQEQQEEQERPSTIAPIPTPTPEPSPPQPQPVSITDKLTKIAGLKDKGIITEEEFNVLKNDLLKNEGLGSTNNIVNNENDIPITPVIKEENNITTDITNPNNLINCENISVAQAISSEGNLNNCLTEINKDKFPTEIEETEYPKNNGTETNTGPVEVPLIRETYTNPVGITGGLPDNTEDINTANTGGSSNTANTGGSTNTANTGGSTNTANSNLICEDGPLQMYNKGPWKFTYQVLKKQGLVIKDIQAGKQLIYDSISVPHFKIESGEKSKIIRYCPDDIKFENEGSSDKKFQSKTIDTTKGIDTLQWSFYKEFDEDDGFKGKLTINYDVVIRWKEIAGSYNLFQYDKPRCEGLNYGFECYRFIPKVSYTWTGSGDTKNLDRFAAFYKIDYASNTGFVPVKDHPMPKAVTDTVGRHPVLTHETSFLAVDNGKEGEYDNIHTAHPGQTVFVPGCRLNVEFDCAHMHWRWSPEADVMFEPSTDNDVRHEPLPIGSSYENLEGTPNLVPGQTIVINIVKYNLGEEDPDDPSTLLTNDEQIATAESIVTKVPARHGEDVDQEFTCYNCKLVKAENTVLWYVASNSNKNTDTFFRHGMFVLDTKPGDERIPIIFIPGIGGTKIFKITPDGNRKEVWPAVRNLGIIDKKALIGMDLKKDGETFVNPAKLELEILRSVGYPPIGTDFYGKILNYLEKKHGYKEGKDLFTFPYNWILDNAKHFDDLDAKVNETLKITGSSKVILIAHSQGGLVSKGYILSKPERSDKVEALITLGTPYGGAPKAYYALIDGYNFDNRDADRKVVKAISQNAPAPYQLLPREPFITDMNDKRKITISESYNSIVYKSMKNDGRTESNVNEWVMNPILLDKANQFWSSFGTPQNPTRIPVDNYIIAGVGTCTLSGYNMKDFDASLFWKVNRIDFSMNDLLFGKFSGTSFKKVTLLPVLADGDETVPLWSSNIKGSTQTWFVKGATHGALAANTQVQTIVGDILNNKNSGSSSPLVPNKENDPQKYTPMKCPQASESILPQMYMLDFSGSQREKSHNLVGKTSGTAMLNPDGNVINGKGKVEIMTSSYQSTEPGKLCEYEIKDFDYKFEGKWKLNPYKDKQNPQGRLDLDLKSEINQLPLKEGPPSCNKKYPIGHSLLLVCAEPVNIDIASKTGNKYYSYGSCEFKIA